MEQTQRQYNKDVRMLKHYVANLAWHDLSQSRDADKMKLNIECQRLTPVVKPNEVRPLAVPTFEHELSISKRTAIDIILVACSELKVLSYTAMARLI